MEFLGVFALDYVGGMSVINTQFGLNLLGVAFAHGLVLFSFVNIGAEVSGAHYNPAVTLAMMCNKSITVVKGIAYILI